MALETPLVISLSVDDWQEFRATRLRAVQLHPHYFLQSFDQASQEPEDYWRNRLSLPRQCIYGMYDRERIIGITGVFVHKNDPTGNTADFGMTFIEPAYRGRKLSRLFYKARIDWAQENGFERIWVSHHIDNVVSKAANQRFGFKYRGEYMRDWPDGTRALDIEYELRL